MADDVELNPGQGGAIARADEIGGKMYQAVKLTLGNDGEDDGFVSADNPIPVSLDSIALPDGAATEASLVVLDADLDAIHARQSDGTQVTQVSNFPATQAVSAAALPLPAGAATEATLALIKAKTDNLDVALSTRAVTGLTDVELRAAPLDFVTDGLTDAELRASAVPISAAALPLPTGAATEATLALIKAKTDNLDVALSTRAVTGLTDAELRASAVPVSGPLTDAELRASPVAVSGTVTTTGLTDAELRASAVTVSGPLTDTELRASPVTISGTVITGGLTDAELRANPVDVANTTLAVVGGGTEATALRVTLANDSTGGVSVDDGGGSLTVDGVFFQATQPVSIAGTVAVSAAALPLPTGAATETTLALIKAKTDNLDVALSTRAVTGLTDAELRASPVPVSGTVSTGGLTDAELRAAPVQVSNAALSVVGGGAESTALRVTLATDSTGVVSIDDNGGSITVDGVFFQATQPVSIAGTVAVSGPLTDTQLRATPVPVSGTVTANVGSTNGLALDATLTGGTAKSIARGAAKGGTAAADATVSAIDADHNALDVKIQASAAIPVTDNGDSLTVDGTVAVTNAALAVVGGGAEATALRVTLANDSTGVVSIDDNGGSLTVDGVFFQATQPVSIAATVAVSGPLTDTELRATPVPVSGTVTANVGSTNGLALDATLTGGTTKAIARGAAKGGTAAADVTVTAIDADHSALDVQILASTAIPVTDNGGSLTVDGTVAATNDALSVVGAGVQAEALRVTLASDSMSAQDIARIRRIIEFLGLKIGQDEQKISVNVGSWMGSGENLLGQGTQQSSIPVTIARDQTPVAVVASAYEQLPSTAYSRSVQSVQTYSAGAGTLQTIQGTAYTEQTTGAKRSLSSASASDASAGTGAQQVTIEYLDSQYMRRYEVVTLNGASAVDTVGADLKYIERITVTRSGSGGKNAGVITLFTAAAGGGSAMATVGTGSFATGGDMETYWSHHYIPAGKTAVVTTMGGQTNATTTSSYFQLRAKRLDLTGDSEVSISPLYIANVAFGELPFIGKEVQFKGPGKITMYSVTSTNAGMFVNAHFDVVEL